MPSCDFRHYNCRKKDILLISPQIYDYFLIFPKSWSFIYPKEQNKLKKAENNRDLIPGVDSCSSFLQEMPTHNRITNHE